VSVADNDLLRDLMSQMRTHFDQERVLWDKVTVLGVEVNALTQQMGLMHAENQKVQERIIATQERQEKSLMWLESLGRFWSMAWKVMATAGAVIVTMSGGVAWFVDRIWPRH